MNDLETIKSALDKATPIWMEGKKIFVSTHYLLPDGDHVTLTVEKLRESFLISDNGQMVNALLSNGRTFSKTSIKKANELCKAIGAVFTDGQFLIEHVDISNLASAILYLADICHRWAGEIILAEHLNEKRVIYTRIYDELISIVSKNKIIRDAEIVGESNRRYHFDFLVDANERKSLIDVTNPSPIAIATTFTKLTDVRRQHKYRQSVIAQGKISNEDINLLQTTADQVWIEEKLQPGFARQIILENSITKTILH